MDRIEGRVMGAYFHTRWWHVMYVATRLEDIAVGVGISSRGVSGDVCLLLQVRPLCFPRAQINLTEGSLYLSTCRTFIH